MSKKNFMTALTITAAFGVAVSSYKCESDIPVSDPDGPNITVQKDSVHYPMDLALIYAGGNSRPTWAAGEMRPYVYRVKDGKVQWLYDGFLYLEIFTRANDSSYSFVVNDANHNPANKVLWQMVLDNTFKRNSAIGGLNSLMDSLHKKGIEPPYKRKVVVSVPNPTINFKDWGELNNVNLDFSKVADRIVAAKWFIDQALLKWKQNRYKQLDLSGFYWVRESITNKNAYEVVQAISQYVHSKGYKFYWIPYYSAGNAGNWKDLGFDMTYQQPNYFFNLKTPIAQLDKSLEFAAAHKMDLEMEFDDRLINDINFRERFYTYLNKFKASEVWKDKHVAYYEGGGAWLNMSKSTDTAVRRAFNTLSDILVERKNGALNSSK